jgi:hypothetical protein
MYPLVQRLCCLHQSGFQYFLIPLQKEYVVFWDLSQHLRLQKMQVNQILSEIFPVKPLLRNQSVLKVAFSVQNLGQGMVFVFSFKYLLFICSISWFRVSWLRRHFLSMVHGQEICR